MAIIIDSHAPVRNNIKRSAILFTQYSSMITSYKNYRTTSQPRCWHWYSQAQNISSTTRRPPIALFKSRPLPTPSHVPASGVISRSVVSNSLQHMDFSLPGSSVHGLSKQDILEWVVFPSLEVLPDLGIKPMSPVWKTDSLPLS